MAQAALAGGGVGSGSYLPLPVCMRVTVMRTWPLLSPMAVVLQTLKTAVFLLLPHEAQRQPWRTQTPLDEQSESRVSRPSANSPAHSRLGGSIEPLCPCLSWGTDPSLGRVTAPCPQIALCAGAEVDLIPPVGKLSHGEGK